MKKKIIWLVVSGLMAVALLAVSCYPAPAKETTPVAPATPAVTEEKSAAIKEAKEAVKEEKVAPTTEPTPVKETIPIQETTPTRVEISGFAFVPATITIAVGTIVTWTNKDSVAHTVSSQDTLFDGGNLSRDATFSYTFNQKGTFEYRCKIHPSMKGKVVVGEEDSGSATTSDNGTDYQGVGY